MSSTPSPTWLAPSVTPTWHEGMPIANHESDSLTLLLMGIALAVAAIGIGIAWLLYGRGPSPAVDRIIGPIHDDHGETAMGKVYEASKHKLWIDEIYDFILVKPFRVDRAWPVRDRRSIHHRHGRGQRRSVHRRLVQPDVAVVPERPDPALPRGPHCRCRRGVLRDGLQSQANVRVSLERRPRRASRRSGRRDRRASARSFAGTSTATASPISTARPASRSRARISRVAMGDIGGQVELWIDDPISHETVSVTHDGPHRVRHRRGV